MTYTPVQKRRFVVVLALVVCAYWGVWLSGKAPHAPAPEPLATGRTVQHREADTQGVLHDATKAVKAKAKEEHELGGGAVVEMQVELADGTRTAHIQMDPDVAPNTVKNFVGLVEEGFFNGATFYRSEPGFVVQGGARDKQNRVLRHPYNPIKLEAKAANKRGTISMARTSDPNSATTEFFINLVDNHGLNPSGPGTGYTVFGHVVSGMDAFDAIAKLPTHRQGGLRMLDTLVEIKCRIL